MATRQFQLNDEQAALLHSAFLHEKHGPTRTRFQAVRHYGIGYRLEEVIQITGCSRTSLFDWCRAYSKQGLNGLVDKRAGGNSRKLTLEQIEDLTAKLHRYQRSLRPAGRSLLEPRRAATGARTLAWGAL